MSFKLLIFMFLLASCGHESHNQNIEILDQCLQSDQSQQPPADQDQFTEAEKALKRSINGQLDIQLCQTP